MAVFLQLTWFHYVDSKQLVTHVHAHTHTHTHTMHYGYLIWPCTLEMMNIEYFKWWLCIGYFLHYSNLGFYLNSRHLKKKWPRGQN